MSTVLRLLVGHGARCMKKDQVKSSSFPIIYAIHLYMSTHYIKIQLYMNLLEMLYLD